MMLEPNEVLNANRICRTCMSASFAMKSLFSKLEDQKGTLGEKLTFITNMSIDIDDNLPKQVCDVCEALIFKSDEFKTKCLESEAMLIKLFNDDSENREDMMAISFKSCIKDESCGIRDKSSSKPYQCSMCLEKFVDLRVLQNHVKNHELIKNDPIFTHYVPSPGMNVTLEDSKLSVDSADSQLMVPCNSVQNIRYEDDWLEYEHYDNSETSTEKDRSCICTCGQTFDNKLQLRNHLKVSNCKKQKLTVSKASKTKKLTTKQAKKVMIKEPIKPKPKSPVKRRIGKPLELLVVCNLCHKEFNNIKEYDDHHYRMHGGPKLDIKRIREQAIKFQCDLCNHKFLKKSGLIRHIQKHEINANKKFTCTTCKRDFTHQAYLDNHIIAIHSRESGYACGTCNMCFVTEEHLNIHKETHKVEKKHQCTVCGKSFNMQSTLNDHMRTHTGEKPFLCSLCGKGFTQKNNMLQHVRRHEGHKPYKCDQCEYKFVTKGELVAHKRKHSGAHPFICDDCGSGFTTASSLGKHRRIHTGERPYACDLCHLTFTASGTLKNHRRTHTGEKPYSCSYCEKAFVQKNDLTSHIRCHTGERPFVCTICGQAYRKSSALKIHQKLHQKEKEGKEGKREPINVKDALTLQLQGVMFTVASVTE